jgi:two-component system, NarL family, sensor histidine kinase FusK
LTGAAYVQRLAPPRPSLSASLGYLAKVAAIAATYCGGAKLGLTLASEHTSISAVWPGSGIGLAALLLWGNRAWPGVLLGAVLANAWTGVPVLVVAGIATGNTLEALAGACLLRRVGFRPSLARVRDVLALFGLAAVASTMVSATLGVASLWIGGFLPWSDLGAAWRVWWFGDLAGDLLIAPLLLVFAGGLHLRPRPARAAEGAALVVAALALTTVVFSQDAPAAYLLFPVVIWAGLRFSQPGATVTTLVVGGIVVWFTAHGSGPFMHGPPDDRLLLAQGFMGVAAMTALLLAAVTSERKSAEQALQRANQQLEAQVQERTVELRRSNVELRRSLGELDQFGHVASHDLSEPLRATVGFAELLSKRYRGRLDDRADGYIDHIVDGGNRMKALIDALLSYPREGEHELHPAEVRCDALLRDATEALSRTNGGTSATVTADPLPAVHADPVLLREVFDNLLSNAVKFTEGDECRVHVAAEREGEGWRISFRDHGIGIAPHHTERVFRVFKRLHGRNDYPGTGIGLATCRKIVESHGGEIWVKPAAGGGSVFSFTLPDRPGVVS